MNRADRRAWRSARTLADLGELTARWIEGDLGEQPAYYGPTDIEDPEMVPVLAALCRSGFMTTCSQAGTAGPGFDGAGWEQRAAVEGFADLGTTRVITEAATAAGLLTVVREPPARLSRWVSYEGCITVTWRAGQPYTEFGVRLPRRHLRSDITGYGICHRDAVDAVCRAWQLAVIDPEPGRPDLLWNTLVRTLIPGRTA